MIQLVERQQQLFGFFFLPGFSPLAQLCMTPSTEKPADGIQTGGQLLSNGIKSSVFRNALIS